MSFWSNVGRWFSGLRGMFRHGPTSRLQLTDGERAQPSPDGSSITGWSSGSTRGDPPSPISKKLSGSVVGPQNLWSQGLWIEGSATPESISSILREVDQGRISTFVDMVHAQRGKDGHLHNCISIFESQVAGGRWVAIPQSSKQIPRKSELKQARILDAVIAELVGWENAKAHLASESEMFPASTVEFVWGMYKGDNPLLHGWFVPQKAICIDTRRFGFRSSDSKWMLDTSDTGYVDFGGMDLDEFPAGKFVTHRVRVTGDVVVREGTGRVTGWLAIFRNWCLRSWMECGEQSWKPYRIATYDKQATDSTTVALANEIVERVIAGGGVAKPSTIDLDITWPNQASAQGVGQHSGMFETLGMEMSKAWLGHTLLVESGSRGARSLGEVGWEVNKVRKLDRQKALAATLYTQLIRPMFAYNTPGKRAPLLVPDLGEQVDIKSFCSGVADLVGKAGMRVQASWVRERLRIPEPQEGEEILGATTEAKPIATQPAQDEGLESEDPDNSTEDVEDEPVDET